MFRRLPRRTRESVLTQAIALLVALAGAGSDLKRSVANHAQSTSIELPASNDIFLSHAREVAGLVGVAPQVEHRTTEAG
jgi:hypothetical protein